MSRVSQEVARALTTELEPRYTKPSFQTELVAVAKKLQRLQTRRAWARRHLKQVSADITRTKRELKALCAALQKGE